MRSSRIAGIVAIVVTLLSGSGDAARAGTGAETASSTRSEGAARVESRADASALYNAGTEALAKNDLGRAVAFLRAAYRIEPRARDIRTNLAIARARVEDVQATGTHERIRPPSAIALSAAESWRLAAILAILGALLAWMAALRGRATRLFLSAIALFTAGLVLTGGLALRAAEERRHPDAVVVAPVLEVGPGPEERPVAPYLLGGGEEIRIGRTRADLAEIRIGGNAIGWADRRGLWRVADAPRYTAKPGA